MAKGSGASPRRPTKTELENAAGTTLRDVITPGLSVLFCGINPGLYSAAIGHHFGRPGNRFWPALELGGFTPRLYSPYEDEDLLKLGYGVTNVVNRATPRADELSKDELLKGAQLLKQKCAKYKPIYLAVLGVGAYRSAFERPKAGYGEQPERLAETRVWVLPNPSGLNANFQIADLASLFRDLKRAADALK